VPERRYPYLQCFASNERDRAPQEALGWDVFRGEAQEQHYTPEKNRDHDGELK